MTATTKPPHPHEASWDVWSSNSVDPSCSASMLLQTRLNPEFDVDSSFSLSFDDLCLRLQQNTASKDHSTTSMPSTARQLPHPFAWMRCLLRTSNTQLACQAPRAPWSFAGRSLRPLPQFSLLPMSPAAWPHGPLDAHSRMGRIGASVGEGAAAWRHVRTAQSSRSFFRSGNASRSIQVHDVRPFKASEFTGEDVRAGFLVCFRGLTMLCDSFRTLGCFGLASQMVSLCLHAAFAAEAAPEVISSQGCSRHCKTKTRLPVALMGSQAQCPMSPCIRVPQRCGPEAASIASLQLAKDSQPFAHRAWFAATSARWRGNGARAREAAGCWSAGVEWRPAFGTDCQTRPKSATPRSRPELEPSERSERRCRPSACCLRMLRRQPRRSPDRS